MQLSWERWDAVGQHKKPQVLCQVCPCDASQSLSQVRSSKEKLCSLSLSHALAVLTASSCVPSWTLLLWKHSRETVQDMAGAQKRGKLFVHLEKEVGMDEILLWLDADRHSF